MTVPKIHWKDTSSYSYSEANRTPREWTLSVPCLSLVVHRHRQWPPETWLLSCHKLHIDCFELTSVDSDDAKMEAIQTVLKHLDTMRANLAATVEQVADRERKRQQ